MLGLHSLAAINVEKAIDRGADDLVRALGDRLLCVQLPCADASPDNSAIAIGTVGQNLVSMPFKMLFS
jgi:hypothetical protein